MNMTWNTNDYQIINTFRMKYSSRNWTLSKFQTSHILSPNSSSEEQNPNKRVNQTSNSYVTEDALLHQMRIEQSIWLETQMILKLSKI